MIGTAKGWAFVWALAIALATHALLPYFPFPRPADHALAPLAEAWADPALFPRDDQIRGFGAPPWGYLAVYWLMKPVLGAGAGFWLATVALTVAGVFAVHAVMRRMGVAGIGLPLAVAVGLMGARPGIGSGAEGGLASGYFQHPWIALVLVFWAFVATLGSRPVLAGLALGAAAYAAPVTALHGALAVALACATAGGPGLRALLPAALSGCVVALPAIFAGVSTGAPGPGEVPVAEALLFAAPDHFRLSRSELLLGWGYLALGALSAAALRGRRREAANMALGLLAGLGLLHLAATLFYGLYPTEFPALILLDATRSSPLYFALAAALFAAAAEDRCVRGLTTDGRRDLAPVAAAAIIAAGLMVANAQPTGWFFLLAGLLVITTPDRGVPRVALAATLMLVFAMVSPRIQLRAPIDLGRIEMFEWANRETPADALFIIPPGMTDFRLFARRSAYAEFGLFAADPGGQWFARERMAAIATPDPDDPALRGRRAMDSWGRTYIAADCRRISRLLGETGASYFVLPTRESTTRGRAVPDCGAGTPAAFENQAFSVFRSR